MFFSIENDVCFELFVVVGFVEMLFDLGVFIFDDFFVMCE